jgi:hypothetical protein
MVKFSLLLLMDAACLSGHRQTCLSPGRRVGRQDKRRFTQIKIKAADSLLQTLAGWQGICGKAVRRLWRSP